MSLGCCSVELQGYGSPQPWEVDDGMGTQSPLAMFSPADVSPSEGSRVAVDTNSGNVPDGIFCEWGRSLSEPADAVAMLLSCRSSASAVCPPSSAPVPSDSASPMSCVSSSPAGAVFAAPFLPSRAPSSSSWGIPPWGITCAASSTTGTPSAVTPLTGSFFLPGNAKAHGSRWALSPRPEGVPPSGFGFNFQWKPRLSPF